MDATVADPIIGRLIDGRYTAQQRLAVGGMATVYIAHDNRLDRMVALKVMHPNLMAEPDFVARFHREARAAASLNTPKVVSVLDYGSAHTAAGALNYLVMELVRGRSLRQHLGSHGRLAPDEAVEVIDAVAEALAAAHAAGIIHRDIKPENILLGDDGQVKVADFGLARPLSQPTAALTQGVVMGTVGYLAPEQVTHGKADTRSDVYAAGVVLFEMLTGQLPHTGATPMSVAYQSVHGDVPPPSTLVPGIAPELDALVLRATARRPEHRLPDGYSLLTEVRQVMPYVTDPGVPLAATALYPQGAHEASASAAVAPAATQVYQQPPAELADGYAQPAASPYQADPYGGHDDGYRQAAAADPGYPSPRRVGPLYADEQPDLDDGDEHDGGLAPRYARGGARRARGGRAGRGGRRGLAGWRPPTPLVVGLAAVVALVLVIVAAAALLGGGASKEVPLLIGLTKEEADAELAEFGLTSRIAGEVNHPTIERGKVVDQSPKTGEKVPANGVVELTLSAGPALTAVPQVRGMTEAEAQAAIQAQGLQLSGKRTLSDDEVAEGMVAGTDPAAGTQVRPGDQITLIISSGPSSITVPDDLIGKKWEDVRQELTALGVEVQRQPDTSGVVSKDRVARTSPAPGETVDAGGTVTVFVSTGGSGDGSGQLVEVPDLQGKTWEQAQGQLRSLGLRADRAGWPWGSRVKQTDPRAGTMVERGTKIRVELD
ncbi:MAG: PASTA domain-containing protein [Frankia sp.]|nr:PASTA domain-containing protein [Frankia sp.]